MTPSDPKNLRAIAKGIRAFPYGMSTLAQVLEEAAETIEAQAARINLLLEKEAEYLLELAEHENRRDGDYEL